MTINEFIGSAVAFPLARRNSVAKTMAMETTAIAAAVRTTISTDGWLQWPYRSVVVQRFGNNPRSSSVKRWLARPVGFGPLREFLTEFAERTLRFFARWPVDGRPNEPRQ